ncbi:putative DNA modification/repair radical SAM protein [Nibricoccus aquaticus]|uniref:Putative DNA modification/repair radical SAM protein n=1 Tax=Nibricoccus aquaticus TaxID=2576891 RepID=A0A290Q7P0_9BACT|nr:putative DNA modification/repair radical SAM protein [Nibricoccus aquaticus]ATC64277.1 putative DNA modification/repair radical SAM protein [Nibricoccus aquaticus]
MEISRKLAILADAAKYDASCASSGAPARAAAPGGLGSTSNGICHSYTPDGRCVSLLKILLTNFCTYECSYCINRRSSNVPRARFTPDEVVDLTLGFYRRNYIEGLFLSSGIIRSPDYTMEQVVTVARKLRTEHRFAGYIHLKTIPEASPELLAEAGRYADRLSINIELPTTADLNRLAPQKNWQGIDSMMGRIAKNIDASAADRRPKRSPLSSTTTPLASPITDPEKTLFSTTSPATPLSSHPSLSPLSHSSLPTSSQTPRPSPLLSPFVTSTSVSSRASNRPRSGLPPPFAPAGQSTQMIVGATPTTDDAILRTADTLYRTHKLRRVYYSAFSPIPDASTALPLQSPPLLREHRLYQADWLLRFYGFTVNEIAPADAPQLDLTLSPKLAWALRNRHLFPVDLNRASRAQLLRIPGLGVRNTDRIIELRRFTALRLTDLARLRVNLKEALPFIIAADHSPHRLGLDSENLRARFTKPAEQLEFLL